MLRSVVSDGTGTEAKISGYTVAGKTGTSRKPPYEPARYMASFAGFAPAESPRLAAIVVIDQPGTNDEAYFGGKVAAPLFSRIMQYALRLERVLPTTVMSALPSDPGPMLAATESKRSATATTATTKPLSGPAASVLTPPPAVPAGIVSQPAP